MAGAAVLAIPVLALGMLLATAALPSGCTRGASAQDDNGAALMSTLAALVSDGGGMPAPDAGMDGGVNPPGACWNRPFTVLYNPNLDPALDGAACVFDSAARLAAFNQAVMDWNTALTNIGSMVRITITSTDVARNLVNPTDYYAADWDQFICKDLATNTQVYTHNYSLMPDMHFQNGKSTGSFGHWGAKVATAGPGWTIDNEEMMGSLYQNFEVLARTKSNPAVGAPGIMTEADIIFHTHYRTFADACARIPWKIGAVANSFDFRSVARHELGHALGLAHLTDNVITNNVMQPTIAPNQELLITTVEENALRNLYGPGRPCP